MFRLEKTEADNEYRIILEQSIDIDNQQLKKYI